MNFRWRLAQFFEIRWWQQYLRQQDPAHYLSWKKNYWQLFLHKSGIQLPAAGAKILDAGCGPAGIFTIFEQHDTHALDPLLEVYEQKLPHFRRSNYPNVQFCAQKLEDFDLPNATGFDVVFCLNAINHVENLGVALDHLVAATRTGGTLAVSVDAHRWALLKILFQWLPGDVLHPHQFSLPEYQQMLARRGCRIDRSILIKREAIFDYFLLVCERVE